MNKDIKDILMEVLTDTYSHTVEDNAKDFQILYQVIWKMANVLLTKDIINPDEYKEILEIKVEK